MPMIFFASLMTLFVHESVLAKTTIKEITIQQLESLLKASKQKPYVFDVNVESTRSHVGIIPGAKLIAPDYNLAGSLPADKKSKLVFYCANTMCHASHDAAERALAAGYSDVNVMSEGIYGWQKAGKSIEKLSASQPLQAQEIDPKEAQELVKKNKAVIVDVREDEERHEVIHGEQSMPMSKVGDEASWQKFKKSLPADKLIIFHCAAGVRSKKVAEKLTAEGVKSSYFKGVDQWKSKGLPVEETKR